MISYCIHVFCKIEKQFLCSTFGSTRKYPIHRKFKNGRIPTAFSVMFRDVHHSNLPPKHWWVKEMSVFSKYMNENGK